MLFFHILQVINKKFAVTMFYIHFLHNKLTNDFKLSKFDLIL